MLPNFLFIGPDKTGSTWIYEVLRKHPQCFVPVAKDLYFFDKQYSRGLEWYAGFFGPLTPSCKAVGELSHDYLFSSAAAERIARDLPGIRLLTCLRDPAERTFSQYINLLRSGWTDLEFGEALREIPELVDNSLYAKHLNRYFQLFPRDAIKVLFFEDLQRNPTQFAKDIFQFIGVDFLSDLNYSERVLPASRPRNAALARVLRRLGQVVRSAGGASLVGSVKRSRLISLLYKPYREDERPRCPREMRTLLQQTFRQDVERLQIMLGRTFPAWLDCLPI